MSRSVSPTIVTGIGVVFFGRHLRTNRSYVTHSSDCSLPIFRRKRNPPDTPTLIARNTNSFAQFCLVRWFIPPGILEALQPIPNQQIRRPVRWVDVSLIREQFLLGVLKG